MKEKARRRERWEKRRKEEKMRKKGEGETG